MADGVVRFDIEGSPTEPSIKELEQQTAQNNARAAQHQREAAALRQVAAQQQQYRVTAGIDAVRGEIEAAKAAYAQSLDRGEFAESAEAQERIATAAARLAQLEQVQNYYQSQPQAPQSTGDAVEDYARGRTEASANWIRNHPEYVRDPRKYARLQAAHHEALANDLTPDSRGYFDHIEKYIGGKGESRVRHNNPNQVTLS